MYRHIMRIGNARYTFNERALNAFVEEARTLLADAPRDAAQGGGLKPLIDEVRGLYHVYKTTESVDALVQLKMRLEEASVAYQSYALAEEVLSINSCLPYERRVPRAM